MNPAHSRVTFTATVTPTGGTPPTGPTSYVYFFDGQSYLGFDTLDENGQARFTINSLEVGVHNIVAIYSGDSIFNGSSDSLTQTILGQVYGRLWLDQNQNGIQDAGEADFVNALVQLKDAAGNVVASTYTNSQGMYGFTNIPLGTYALAAALGDGYEFSPQDQGSDDAVDSDVNNLGLSDLFTLLSDDDWFKKDAGLFQSI